MQVIGSLCLPAPVAFINSLFELTEDFRPGSDNASDPDKFVELLCAKAGYLIDDGQIKYFDIGLFDHRLVMRGQLAKSSI